MGDVQCQVFSSNNKATLANNGLLIMLYIKDQTKRQYVQCIANQRSYCGSMDSYGADQEQKFDEAVLVIDYTSR